MSEGKKNELAVITMTKELAKYVMTVTQKSPKHFRFSLVAKLQSLSIEAVEYMYRANDFYVSKDRRDEYEKRLSCQRQAMTALRLLTFMAEIAEETGCIFFKQYENICRQAESCENKLGAWITGDRRRMGL